MRISSELDFSQKHCLLGYIQTHITDTSTGVLVSFSHFVIWLQSVSSCLRELFLQNQLLSQRAFFSVVISFPTKWKFDW